MPFSWKKKTRRNRFSQLVADHLQSPKRGGSLVVETGFPTSIIDLYVRNRGRFRKSGVKKQSEYESNESLSPLSSNPSLDSGNLTFGGSDHTQIDEIVEEIEEIDEIVGVRRVTSDDSIRNCSEIEVELSVEMVKLNPVLVGVLKGLLIMGLVFLTKGFTIGITVLAFMLILLESVAERWSFRETDDVRSLEESEVLEIEEEEEQVETKADEVRSEGLMEIKRKGSRRAVMKSRMKKLVPKKLRKSSVDSKEEIVKASECSDSKGESLRVLKQNHDEIVEVEVKVNSSGIECNGLELGRGLRSSLGCLVLCLVVLVGLIGGRVLALVLALSWCLMLKKLQWRNVKFPVS